MKSIWIVLLCFVLVACGNQEAAEVAPSVADKAPLAQEPIASEMAPVAKPFYEPLPDSTIRFEFPFHFVSDKFYSTDKGQARRGISLEYLDGTAEIVWSKLGEALGRAGYKPVKEVAVDASGKMQQSYMKNGGDGFFVSLSPSPGNSPSNPKAKGVIWISWGETP